MMPPTTACDDPVDRQEEALLGIVPRERRKSFDMRKLLRLVLDEGSFFEIAPTYGRSRITGLARVGGHAIGVMANNPRFHGGATDVSAGSKAMRLMQLCNTFHLPLVSLADEPGFHVGIELQSRRVLDEELTLPGGEGKLRPLRRGSEGS